MSTKEEWKYAAMDFGAPSVIEDTGTPEMLLLFAQSLVFRMPVRQNYELWLIISTLSLTISLLTHFNRSVCVPELQFQPWTRDWTYLVCFPDM